MRLYHIRLGNHLADESTALCIPESGYDGEDKVTPRICLSPTLDGCLTGCTIQRICIGWLLDSNVDTTEELPKSIVLPWTIEKFEVNPKDTALWAPEKVKSEGGVIDALVSREYWYTKSVEPVNKSVRFLTSFQLRLFQIADNAITGWKVCNSSWSEKEEPLSHDAWEKMRKVTLEYLST